MRTPENLVVALRELAERRIAELPTPGSPAGGIGIERLIATHAATATPAMLEWLAKRIEVGHRLGACYPAEGAGTPIDEADVRPEFAAALRAAFARAGAAGCDWKWINTALKMQDGILTRPVIAADPDLDGILDQVLDRV